MAEVKTNHLYLHNKLSLAYVIFVHSVNHQSMPITLSHTAVVSQTTQPDEKPLAVTEYHFTFWPDHGVPKFATSFISFIRRVQKAHNKAHGVPLLVHCSAGVGRTGTFILLDSMLERIKAEKTVNMYGFLVGLHQKRVFHGPDTGMTTLSLHQILHEIAYTFHLPPVPVCVHSRCSL